MYNIDTSTLTRRRIVQLALPPILVALPIWICGRALVAVNADPPVKEANALKGALEGARRARAPKFAPDEYRSADALARQALSFHYRALGAPMGFLDYDLARSRIRLAHHSVDKAWLKAARSAGSAREESRRLIDAGSLALVEARRSVESLPIGHVTRGSLASAEVRIDSAEARWKAGDYARAAQEAKQARGAAEEVLRRAGTFLAHYTNGSEAKKWTKWVEKTLALSRRTGQPVILVDKLKRKCHLVRGGRLVRSFEADLGGPLWDKLRSGDRATPEGMYKVVQKRGKGQTIYYKALLINYPNDEDRAQFALAKKKGWISRRATIGGLIEIHGSGGRNEDWTLGCVALANRDMDELFRHVQVGTPVTIVGTITRGGLVSG